MATATDQQVTTVLGIGVTGLSVARFLMGRGVPFAVCDTRDNPPKLAEFKRQFADIPRYLGADAERALGGASELVVSPGLAPSDPLLVAARDRGVPVIGDIELFARHVNAPVVAITGSNGKSTVTELLGEMARAAAHDVAIGNVAVGGNLGVPALELLDDRCGLYVLELSSFQLEITESLQPVAACILNLSEDHLDRYGDMASYLAAKQRIFGGAEKIVVNRDDRATYPVASDVEQISFGLSDEGDFGIAERDGQVWLTGPEGDLISTDELALKGRHNWANALAALALGSAAGLPMAAMLRSLQSFGGLAHRCQTLRQLHGVTYINDSKATNVGATLAALQGLADSKRQNILWIAGGEGKGAEFDELKTAVAGSVKQALLIGADAGAIAKAVAGSAPVALLDSLEHAVERAQQLAEPGDMVLLSPACASFDMFCNFEARGDAFAAAVEALS